MTINFDAESHTYERNGQEYHSASRIIKWFKPKFPKQFIAAAVAKRDGKTKKEVLAEWQLKADIACHWGSYVHTVLEDIELGPQKKLREYVPFNENDERNPDLIIPIVKSYKRWREKHSGKSIPEEKLWIDDFFSCGTADLPIEYGTYFDLFDFKTNEELNDDNKYKKYFGGVLCHIADTKIQGYTLQLSLYAFMKKKLTGLEVGRLAILWIKADGEIEEIEIEYAEQDVINMLLHYNPSYEHISKIK